MPSIWVAKQSNASIWPHTTQVLHSSGGGANHLAYNKRTRFPTHPVYTDSSLIRTRTTLYAKSSRSN